MQSNERKINRLFGSEIMIILAISGCLLNSYLPQCGVVYDHINSYHDVQACTMRAEHLLESDDHPTVRKAAFCIDWKRKDTEGLQQFLNMIGGYHPKERA